MVLCTLCKVGELGETIEVISRLDQRIEASLRRLRFDKFIEGVSRQSRICRASIRKSRLHRGRRGYIVDRSKKRGFIETIEVTSRLGQKIEASSRHLRFDKFIESQSNLRTPSIKVIESHRGLMDPLSLINVAYVVQSPTSYMIITSDKKKDSSCGEHHHLLTIDIPVYICSPFHL
jgi:hypothetical protein